MCAANVFLESFISFRWQIIYKQTNKKKENVDEWSDIITNFLPTWSNHRVIQDESAVFTFFIKRVTFTGIDVFYSFLCVKEW